MTRWCDRSPSSRRPTSGSGRRAPTASSASRAATTATRSSTRRCPSAPCAGAGRSSRRWCRARPPSSASPSTATSGCPDFEPPYVIANVALAEDPHVHLTTNIVGLRARRGARRPGGAVRFEQQDDVWLPLFEPTGATSTTTGSTNRTRPTPRAPLGDERFEHRVRAVGRRPLGHRSAPDARSAVADRRRLPGRGGRRRSHARRHRRPLDLSRGAGAWA